MSVERPGRRGRRNRGAGTPAPTEPVKPATPPPVAPHGIQAESAAWAGMLSSARRSWVMLASLFAAALLLRFFKLGESELWLDEVLVFFDAKAGTHEHASAAHDLHLNILGWILNHIGATPFWLRAWGAFTGALAVPFVALAGLWFGDRRSALVWGLFATIHPFLIFYAQDANYYGPMTLFAAIQVAMYVAFFRGAPLASLLMICLAGAAAFFNHPVSLILTGFCIGGCVLGSLIFPSLRRQIYDWNPKKWLANPAIPLIGLFVLVAVPLAIPHASRIWNQFTARLSVGEAPEGVELSLEFFSHAFAAYGVSYFMREGIARTLAWIPFLMCCGGMVLMILRRERRPLGIAFAGLTILAPAAGFLFVFNMRHHGFYPRYLTYFLPLYIGCIGWFCAAVGDKLAASNQRRAVVVTAVAAAVIAVIQLPYLAMYYAKERSNFATLAEVLREQRKPGEPIFVPEQNDMVQARYYLEYLPQQAGESPVVDEHTRVRDPGERDASRRSFFMHRLYGVESAWVISAWRVRDYPVLYDFFDNAMPPLVTGFSPHSPKQNAHLHKWDYGRRVLFRTAATRFEDEALETSGRSRWLAEAGGRWRLTSVDGDTSATVTLIPASTGTPQEMALDGKSIFSVERDTVVEVTTSAGINLGTMQATPVYDEHLVLGPYDVIHYPEDSRNWEREFDGEPVLEKMFDGLVSHLLYVPPGEKRQLVLRTVRRNEAKMREIVPDQITIPDFNLAVACDGVHMGTFIVSGGDQELIRIPTGIELPPGNHQIDINGFTFREGYAPANNWMWGGLEFNTEILEAQPALENFGLAFVRFPEPAIPWGKPGEKIQPPFYINQEAYPAIVSTDVVGPSGNPALEIDLTKELSGDPSTYSQIMTPPMPTAPGSILAFSTYIKIEDPGSHAAQLVVIEFNADGVPFKMKIGDQQLMRGRYAVGWRRFIEMYQVSRDAAAVSAGVMIFPPDPEKIDLRGRILVDSIRSLIQAREPIRPPNLDKALFFPVDGTPATSQENPSQ